MNTTTKIIIGITVAATGVAVGMLLAPQKTAALPTRVKAGAKDWLCLFSAGLSTSKKSTFHDPAHFPSELTSEMIDLDSIYDQVYKSNKV